MIQCPICLEDAIPPVILVPCGDVICGPCVQQLRVGAQTALIARRANFRCPCCRVLAKTYVISRALEIVPTTDEQRQFIAEYQATAPAAAEPQDFEVFAANAQSSDEENDDDNGDDGNPQNNIAPFADPRTRFEIQETVNYLMDRIPRDLQQWQNAEAGYFIVMETNLAEIRVIGEKFAALAAGYGMHVKEANVITGFYVFLPQQNIQLFFQ